MTDSYTCDVDGFQAVQHILLHQGLDIDQVDALTVKIIEAYERATWKLAFHYTIQVSDTDELIEARNEKGSMIWRARILRRNMKGPLTKHLDFNPTHWRYCRDISNGGPLWISP